MSPFVQLIFLCAISSIVAIYHTKVVSVHLCISLNCQYQHMHNVNVNVNVNVTG